jgi:hypothetical protein
VGAAVLIAALPIVLCSAEIARTFAFFYPSRWRFKDGISKMAVKDESLSFHSELAQSSAKGAIGRANCCTTCLGQITPTNPND